MALSKFLFLLCSCLLAGLLAAPLHAQATQSSSGAKPSQGAAKAQPKQQKPAEESDSSIDLQDLHNQLQQASQDDPQVQQLLQQMGVDQKIKAMQQAGVTSVPAATGAPVIPRKDPARIALVRRQPMTEAELLAYLQKLHAAVAKTLPPKTTNLAEAIYKQLKSHQVSAGEVNGAAIGCWAVGALDLAVYLAGKASVEAPSNPNITDNYAAFLTMGGAEEMALPILLTLKQKYPDNSTLLNNIGQAWFGLGDVNEAKKNLDDAIRRYPFHSQANLTLSVIEEAQGNQPAAVAALRRSMQFAFSPTKYERLRHLHYEPTAGDIVWNIHMPQDPLGLHRITPPEYPKSLDDAEKLEPVWDSFEHETTVMANALNNKADAESRASDEVQEKRAEKIAADASRGSLSPGAVGRPPFFHKAFMMYQQAKDSWLLQSKLWQTQKQAADVQLQQLKLQRDARMAEITKQYEDPYKEPATPECDLFNELNEHYLGEANSILEGLQNDLLAFQRRWIDDSTYYLQYMTSDDLRFEVIKAQAKEDYLGVLNSLNHETASRCGGEAEKTEGNHKLEDFDDIHCKYETKYDLAVMQVTIRCNHMETKFEVGPLNAAVAEHLRTGHISSANLGVKGVGGGSLTQDEITGNVTGGTLEIGGASGSVQLDPVTGNLVKGTLGYGVNGSVGVEAGPVEAKVSGSVGAFVEFDSSGITDAGVRGKVGVEVGTAPYEETVVHTNMAGDVTLPVPRSPSVEIEISGEASVNAGSSMEGKAELKGMAKGFSANF